MTTATWCWRQLPKISHSSIEATGNHCSSLLKSSKTIQLSIWHFFCCFCLFTGEIKDDQLSFSSILLISISIDWKSKSHHDRCNKSRHDRHNESRQGQALSTGQAMSQSQTSFSQRQRKSSHETQPKPSRTSSVKWCLSVINEDKTCPRMHK
jgi:hypothetical protein